MPFLTQIRAAPNLLTLLRLFSLPFLVIAILDGPDLALRIMAWRLGRLERKRHISARIAP